MTQIYQIAASDAGPVKLACPVGVSYGFWYFLVLLCLIGNVVVVVDVDVVKFNNKRIDDVMRI